MSDRAPMALVVCPLCGRAAPPAAHEGHSCAAHGLLSYRGVLWGLSDGLAAIRADLLAAPPVEAAWQALVGMSRAEPGDPAEWLAAWLAMALSRLTPAELEAALPRLAALVQPEGDALIAALAARAEPAARALALECIAARPAPVAPRLVGVLRGLMYGRELSEATQDRITAIHLLTPEGEALGGRMLRWVTARLDRGDALRRLARLRERAGRHPLIEQAEARWQKGLRLTCPKCDIDLTREEMEAHLWRDHRLLLDGLRVLDAWELIDEWARQYRTTGDKEVLERCRLAAARVDPEGGPDRLGRILLSLGAGDAPLRAALLARAAERHAGLCPWCYAEVPVPEEAAPLEVNLRPGRLSAGGYEVEVSEAGLFTRLRIVTPAGLLSDGQEPGQPLTPAGAATAFGGPIAGLALLLAAVWPVGWLGSAVPMALFFVLLAAMVALFAWLLARFEKPSPVRLLSYAWGLLVPNLNARGVVKGDCAFVAGLARLTSRLERMDAPGAALNTQMRLMSEGGAAPGHLAPLVRLQAEMAAASGDDPIAAVERWVGRCFEGKLPLSFAQRLLEEWATGWWTVGQVARLRARLCDRAFEAGFEVQGLLDAGNNAPALGAVLGVDSPRELSGLRLLWSLRPARPWDRLGDARTAFELAEDPAWLSVFEAHPGVLLWQEDPHSALADETSELPLRAAEIVLTAEAVWVQGEPFTAPPRVFEVRTRAQATELRLGGRVFRSPNDLEPLARLLERWFRYAFHEFLPGVDKARGWVSPDRSALLRAWGAVPCPECRRHLLPRVGAVGVGLDQRLT